MNENSGIKRRTLLKGAAWSVPVVAAAVATPFAAASGCTDVLHLAALIAIPHSYAAAQTYVETNILGTLNILEAARQGGTDRIVHTSTSEVYGTALKMPISEEHPLQGQSPYSASKIGADMMSEAFARSFGLPVVTLRPFNTFGPRQSERATVG